MDDDCFGSPDPPLDLRNRVCETPGGGFPNYLSALSEVLVHVLSEVSEQGELLV